MSWHCPGANTTCSSRSPADACRERRAAKSLTSNVRKLARGCCVPAFGYIQGYPWVSGCRHFGDSTPGSETSLCWWLNEHFCFNFRFNIAHNDRTVPVCLSPPHTAAAAACCCVCTPSTNLTHGEKQPSFAMCCCSQHSPRSVRNDPWIRLCQSRRGPQAPSERDTPWIGRFCSWTKSQLCSSVLPENMLMNQSVQMIRTPISMKPFLASDCYASLLIVHVNTWDTASSSPSRRDGDTPTAEGDLASLNQHSWQSNLARLSPHRQCAWVRRLRESLTFTDQHLYVFEVILL